MSNLNPVLIEMNTHIWFEVCFLRNLFTMLLEKNPEQKNLLTPNDIKIAENAAQGAVLGAMEEFRNKLIEEANKPENVSVNF